MAYEETPKTQPALAPVLIGADLGSNHIRVGAVDPTGRILDYRREPYAVGASSPEAGRVLAEQLLKSVAGLIAAHSAEGAIAAIGVGLPGLVNQSTSQIVSVPHVPSLIGFDLYGEFKRAFDLPVYFENNSNAAAYAEMQIGAAKGESDWLYLHIGAGIGAGLVLDGKLRRGKSGFAGEIGHINIDPEGLECPCGSIGCLETMVSAPNIVRRTRLRLRRDATSSLSTLGAKGGFTYEDIIEAAQRGDDLAKMMLERTGHFIGRALAGVINLLNLSMVAVGGAPGARPFLVKAIAAETSRRAFAAAYEDCRIVAAELDGEAGVIGAALLAYKRMQKISN
jgi:glucokinase